MKPSLWWIGSHWRVCHLARMTLPSPSPSLSACQHSRWQRGPPGDHWLPVKLHLLPSVENPPQPAVFQDRRTAVTAKTLATRRGLSHKTSKASAAMKTQVRRGLVNLYSSSFKWLRPTATTHSFHAIHSFFMLHSRRSKMCHLFCSWHVQMSDSPYNAAHNGAVYEKFNVMEIC